MISSMHTRLVIYWFDYMLFTARDTEIDGE